MYYLQFIDCWRNDDSEFITCLYRIVRRNSDDILGTVTHDVCEGFERSLHNADCHHDGSLANWAEHWQNSDAL